jgi:hypothetical protein
MDFYLFCMFQSGSVPLEIGRFRSKLAYINSFLMEREILQMNLLDQD